MIRDKAFTQQRVDTAQQDMVTDVAELENMTPQQIRTMVAVALNRLGSEARQDVAAEAMQGCHSNKEEPQSSRQVV
jgi:hypothetical protein